MCGDAQITIRARHMIRHEGENWHFENYKDITVPSTHTTYYYCSSQNDGKGR
jgi:hypothetical protein